jgi:hypothetical protein
MVGKYGRFISCFNPSTNIARIWPKGHRDITISFRDFEYRLACSAAKSQFIISLLLATERELRYLCRAMSACWVATQRGLACCQFSMGRGGVWTFISRYGRPGCSTPLTASNEVAKVVKFRLNCLRYFWWGGVETSPLLLKPLLAYCTSPWWRRMWNNRWNAWQRGENLPQCRFVQHTCHKTWPGLEAGTPRWEACG